MRRLAIVIVALGLSVLLSGCAGGPVSQRAAEQPVSQQVTTTEAGHRAKLHTELGGLYLSQGNLGVALEEARKALSADAGYAPAYSLMGLVRMQLREEGPAEASFERALKLAPADPEINNMFGWFLCQTGRERRSLQYFREAIKSPLYATPTMPYTNAGICSLRLKDDKAAEDYFVKALRADGANQQALYFLADIAYRQGRLAAARLHIAERHRLAEPSAETLWLALRIERKLGDREAESRFSSQMRRKFPAAPETLHLMQGIYE